MYLALFAVFVVLPLVEIALLVKIGQGIGFWATLGIVVLSAMAGTWVLNTQGFAVMRRTIDAINAGRPPMGTVIDGTFLLLAGLLLIAPGLITDALGILLLVPQIRHRVAAWSVRKALRSGRVNVEVFRRTDGTRGYASSAGGMGNRTAGSHGTQGDQTTDGPVIEGEFERLDERAVDPGRHGNRGSAPRPNGAGDGPHGPR